MLTNPPNLLTGARVLAVPAMVAAFWLPGGFGKWVTCAIFTLAAVTDYLDGYLARSWSMQSPFGRMLDPIADKLLVGAAILMLVHFDRAPILPALITGFALALARGVGEYGSVIFIAGNMPGISEIVPLLIVIELEQYNYAGATVLAALMLLASFVLLLAINLLQRWSRSWSG